MGPFFVENRGQAHDEGVRFLARGDGISASFTDDGVTYRLEGEDGRADFSLSWVGGDAIRPEGEGVQGHRVNYLIGNDRSGWVRGAASYGSVLYRGVQEGVDLRFHFKEGMLKYDLILGAETDLEDVVLEYRGVEGLRVDQASGDLLVDTTVGTVRDARPVFLQDGLVEGAEGEYLLLGGGRFAFGPPPGLDLGRPFVVDPGIAFATLLGGSAYDEGLMATVDGNGDIILGGQGNSTDLPTTPGANRTSAIGFWDGFCAKYDSTGTVLKFMTYFGGGLDDNAFDMEVDTDGSIWFAGMTYSRNFPTTEDALFPDFLGGYVDGFLVQLSNDGADLLYSTYIGGTFSENLRSLEFDDQGYLYAAGVTNSWDLPVTVGAYCRTRVDTSWDLNSGFIVKIDPDLNRLEYCTYVNDMATDSVSWYPWLEIAVDGTGRVYLASATNRADFPVTGGAFCTTKDPNFIDGVLLALDPTGSTLLYSTFLGGNGEDSIYYVNVGPDGLVYVTGHTNSTDYPTTEDALSRSPSMYQDAILTVMEGDLSALRYSTYFSGNGGDVGISAAASPSGDMFYLYGSTRSTDLTTTPGCFDPVKRGYWYDPDCFIVAFSSSDHSLVYSSYFGGSLVDGGTNKGLVCLGNGDLLLVGGTTSADFPTTPGVTQASVSGSMDAFLVKLSPGACDLPDGPDGLTAERGDGQVRLTWSAYTENQYRILSYRVYRRTDGGLEPVADIPWPQHGWYLDEGLVNGALYTYAISAVNSAGEGPLSDTVQSMPLGLPNATTGLSATSGDGTVRLDWSAPSNTGGSLLGYHVLRGPTDDNLTHLATVNDGTAFVDEGCVLGELHSYAVIAYNEAGNGSLGDVIRIKAVDVPMAPTNFGKMEGDGTVDLYWDRPESDGGEFVEGYRLYRGMTPFDQDLLADLDRTVTTYTDSSLQNGGSYYYYVTAYSSVGEGGPSKILQAVPFTFPGRTRALAVEAGDSQVVLSWTAPSSYGGRPITAYVVQFSEGDDSLSHSFELGNVTSYIHTGLTNGIEYFYAVSAVNLAGPGELSNIANATPMGLPGVAEDCLVVSDLGKVCLSWSEPADRGGATELKYRVLRGTSSGTVDTLLVEGTDIFGYVDEDVSVGDTYYYRIEAGNCIGCSLSDVLPVKVTDLPGQVRNLLAVEGDGYVQLSWEAPLQDGASPISGYSIMRGSSTADMVEIALVGVKLEHNDTSVVNGQDYVYSVRAVTSVGVGPDSDADQAGPRSRPPVPGSVGVRVKGDRVILSWVEPSGTGMAEVTGYRVYRRTASGQPELIATLEEGVTYTDKDVKAGRTYYYSVMADSDFGAGQMSSEYKAAIPSEEGGFPLIYLLVLLLIVVLGAVLGVALSRRGRAAAIDVAEEGKAQYLVEEAFVVLQDGKLVTHGTRAEDGEADVSMMSGMLIAVQGIMQDGLEREGALESIKYGDNLIQIATGQHVNVVAVLYGTPDEELMEDMQAIVQSIEATYAGVIEEWVGDLKQLEGINEMVEPLIARTRDLTREDVARAAVKAGVSLQSAVDFHRGYVRLKVSAVNASEESVMDAGVEVHYDRDLLRLDKVEPEGVGLRGDKAELGNLKAGERKALAFMFDPQICQDTYLDGTLSYYDPKGNLKHVEMKRRHANVVCPIFFTKEHANTAMLRRLVKEKLHVSDARLFRYSASIRGPDILEVGKKALSGIDIQLVREFVTEGPPFEAEVWYYGETQVKGYQMVMRVGVLEEKGVLEFFVASTDMEPLTGLLAEFRREFEWALEEQFPGTEPPEMEMDTDLRFEMEARPLRIDELEEEEGEG